jgi:dihydropteroate synthase
VICKVMGVLNVTPDSFYDGGRYLDHDAAIRRALEMIDQGADVIDVGGESTRPGAGPVAADEECRRVIPVIEAIADSTRVSVDTSKPEVARAAIAAGATLVNDVSSSLSGVAAEASVGIVLMHMAGTPMTMQRSPRYDDVVAEVFAYLRDAAAQARRDGVVEIYVDPGIGFGKNLADNLALLRALPALVDDGVPVLVGTSRKSMLGRIATRPGSTLLGPEERFEASVATAAWSIACGAAMVRAHDVKATAMAAQLAGESVGAHSTANGPGSVA